MGSNAGLPWPKNNPGSNPDLASIRRVGALLLFLPCHTEVWKKMALRARLGRLRQDFIAPVPVVADGAGVQPDFRGADASSIALPMTRVLSTRDSKMAKRFLSLHGIGPALPKG